MKISTRQRVYEYLWSRLLQGECPPGTPVLAQEIAKALGVSRIPVREAMFQLCAEGLLERTQQRGMIVSAPTRQEILELLDVRATLESRAAAIAARKITTVRLNDLERLTEAFSRVVKETASGKESTRSLLRQWGLIDMMFHRVLILASGNIETLKVVERSVIRMLGFAIAGDEAWSMQPERLKTACEVHARIVAALAEHDPHQAREALLAHAKRARRTLLDRFEWCLRQGRSSELPPVPWPQWLRELVEEIGEHNLVGTNREDRNRLPMDGTLKLLWGSSTPT